MRVYCPDCAAPRQVPDDMVGRRLRCRNCDRVFRVGARNEPSRREPEPDDIDPGRHRTAAWVIACAILLIVGLVVGGGLTAWYFLTHGPEPAEVDEPDPDDPGPPGRPPQFDRIPGDPD